jgi:hypothetical protein
MPLHCEEWLIALAEDILGRNCINVLNLFCGTNKIGFRVDISESVKPDLVCDAHKISDMLEKESFDVILADPPYSTKESKELYGTKALKYKKWTGECEKLLKPGGLLIIYHKYVVPNPNNKVFTLEKRVFIGNRVWHLPRVAMYFKKTGNLLEKKIGIFNNWNYLIQPLEFSVQDYK